MVIELTFESESEKTRRIKILVGQSILTELIENNETLIKLIKKERNPGEVLTGIRDLDV
nr:MAG TPA: hypothetical protein [Microviridae sp.]